MPDSGIVRNIALWGTSISGQMCFEQIQSHNMDLKCVINRQANAGEKFGGIDVVSPENLTEKHFHDIDLVILAFHGNAEEAKSLIRKFGYDKGIFQYVAGSDLGKAIYGQINLKKLFENTSDLAALSSLIYTSYNSGSTAIIVADSIGEQLQYELENNDSDKNELFIFSGENSLESIPMDMHQLFVIGSSYVAIQKIKAALKRRGFRKISDPWSFLQSLDPETLLDSFSDEIWDIPDQDHIYPVDIPDFYVEENLDFLLMDPPPRFLGIMPNGLGYVHNILEMTGINFQTLDLDVIFYHRFHGKRLLEKSIENRLPGFDVTSDPWAMENVEKVWPDQRVVEYFKSELEEVVESIAQANPKMLGLSLHSTNLPTANYLASRVREISPETIIIAGGYDCIDPDSGPKAFKNFDYMVIFEAEKSLPELVKKILNGHPADGIPGVIAKKTQGLFPFTPAEQLENLDEIPFPKYQWIDINLYRNWNGYQLTPVMMSRGCRWSRCTFCGERFHWRKRSVENFVDELEWLRSQGCKVFVFNDSDLSGDPELVAAICQEIIDRGINDMKLTGQLRVQKGYTQEYFHLLKNAGFTALRYGIDAWAKNPLKLHKKGYTLQMIEEVLAYTVNAGIYTTINLVLGIPGETEEDIDETIDNMIRCKHLYGQIENINSLILTKRSVYWEQLEKFPITLREPKQELADRYSLVIPSDLWYSTEPYIDQEVRRKRVERLVDAARQNNILIGGWADFKVQKIVNNKKDTMEQVNA